MSESVADVIVETAQAESLVTGKLTVIAGSCGPGNFHFINGVFEANRTRAPLILIASQVASATRNHGERDAIGHRPSAIGMQKSQPGRQARATMSLS